MKLLDLRYNCFMRLVATSTTTIKPQSLPATEERRTRMHPRTSAGERVENL